jgi:hypothetical protein
MTVPNEADGAFLRAFDVDPEKDEHLDPHIDELMADGALFAEPLHPGLDMERFENWCKQQGWRPEIKEVPVGGQTIKYVAVFVRNG